MIVHHEHTRVEVTAVCVAAARHSDNARQHQSAWHLTASTEDAMWLTKAQEQNTPIGIASATERNMLQVCAHDANNLE